METLSVGNWVFRITRAVFIGVLLGLSTNACGLQGVRPRHMHDESNVELVYYANIVAAESNGKMRLDPQYSRIGFRDSMSYLGKSVAGFCAWVLPLSYDIDISRETWLRSSYENKVLLVAHEMYHCVCKNIIHDDREDNYGCPESYFHSSMPPSQCAKDNFNKYLKQVAKGCDL